MALTGGSLFSGIGGIDRGLQRAGIVVRWQVEIDDYCNRVLAKHWPDVARYRDVRECGKHNLEPVDLIAGGFPCTDISSAGRKRGIGGEQSGLWREFARIVRELRPAYVLVENVADITKRGLGVVLGDLAALGYDAEWSVLSACAMGAPHTRERLFVVAYANGHRYNWTRLSHKQRQNTTGLTGSDPGGRRESLSKPWNAEDESRIRRVSDGVSYRMDRLRGLGNAVVPQVVEDIGHRIIEAEAQRCSVD